jgi:hypothetical protein
MFLTLRYRLYAAETFAELALCALQRLVNDLEMKSDLKDDEAVNHANDHAV